MKILIVGGNGLIGGNAHPAGRPVATADGHHPLMSGRAIIPAKARG